MSGSEGQEPKEQRTLIDCSCGASVRLSAWYGHKGDKSQPHILPWDREGAKS